MLKNVYCWRAEVDVVLKSNKDVATVAVDELFTKILKRAGGGSRLRGLLAERSDKVKFFLLTSGVC